MLWFSLSAWAVVRKPRFQEPTTKRSVLIRRLCIAALAAFDIHAISAIAGETVIAYNNNNNGHSTLFQDIASFVIVLSLLVAVGSGITAITLSRKRSASLRDVLRYRFCFGVWMKIERRDEEKTWIIAESRAFTEKTALFAGCPHWGDMYFLEDVE